jgi:hypothetical protein
MDTAPCRPISTTCAMSGKRLRIAQFSEGAQLCLPILGYWHRPDGLTVYVAGTTPPHLRTAAEEGRQAEEVLLSDLRGGLQEIELEDCRHQYRVLPAPARALPLVVDSTATYRLAA